MVLKHSPYVWGFCPDDSTTSDGGKNVRWIMGESLKAYS
jgi:hypothetical protein